MKTEGNRKLELLKLARKEQIRYVNEGHVQPSSSFSSNSSILLLDDEMQTLLHKTSELFDDILPSNVNKNQSNTHKTMNINEILQNAQYEFDQDNNNEYMNMIENDTSLEQLSFTQLYRYFLYKLKLPIFKDIIHSIRKYILKVNTTITRFETHHTGTLSNYTLETYLTHTLPSDMNEYITNLCLMMKETALWTINNNNDKLWYSITLCCEQFIHIKLYPTLMELSITINRLKDEKLYQRISKLSFLQPCHLDIHIFDSSPSVTLLSTVAASDQSSHLPAVDAHTHTLASTLHPPPPITSSSTMHVNNTDSYQCFLIEPKKLIDAMMHAKSPSAKLECLKQCTQTITRQLTQLTSTTTFSGDSTSGSAKGNQAGADMFLPLIILLLKECNPPHLASTLHYLQHHSNPAYLSAEYGYLLTCLVSATEFLESCDASMLTIAPEVFDMYMYMNRPQHILLGSGTECITDSTVVAAEVNVGPEAVEARFDTPLKHALGTRERLISLMRHLIPLIHTHEPTDTIGHNTDHSLPANDTGFLSHTYYTGSNLYTDKVELEQVGDDCYMSVFNELMQKQYTYIIDSDTSTCK